MTQVECIHSMHGNLLSDKSMSVSRMAVWQVRLQVTEVSIKCRVHELPAWPFIHSWNPLACYIAHSLSVIQLRINRCMSACVFTYTSHRLLLIKSLLRLAPGRCSIPLVISLVLAVCCFVLIFFQQIQLSSSLLDIKYCMCFTIAFFYFVQNTLFLG